MTDDVRWLDDAQRNAWTAIAGLLVALPAELDSEMQRRAGITQFEYLVMAALSEAPDRTLRISTLARFAQGTLSRLSHLIKRLEKRGWLRREPDPGDGRFTNAILTDAGYAKVVATAPGQVELVRRLVVDVLTPAQLQRLGDTSRRILGALHPGDGC
ncbi:MarR family winged helix-turn-helix transcriptional regulator [Actinoplanes sp. N902-109]|uniref:MarR family winged helix-turn-helix transcriptional regulator n=1 Tax=Actinoplanes sp. (strain N902-109) TaxID=649831 RepID=UPI00032950B5|nr:MarR family transcriptional regulator [Actinoplanes sp. N902-109]AGL18324.1 MarR family transcriptional regulator [Actinoplanes sp. N902-109]